MLFKTGDKVNVEVEIIEVDDVGADSGYHLKIGETNDGLLIPVVCFEQAAKTADPQIIVKLKQKELDDLLAKAEQLKNELKDLEEEGESN